MGPRDLKIAAIMTAACLMISFAASYSYVHNWHWTSGVFPLALTVIMVLISTVVLEAVGGPSMAALASTTSTRALLRRRRELHSLILRRTELLLSPLLWLVLLIIQLLFSLLGRAKREQSHEMLRLLSNAHS